MIIGNVNCQDKEFLDFVNFEVNKIIQTNNTNGRTPQQIYNNAFNGIAAEYFLIKNFGFQKSQDWRYDLYDTFKTKYEVKTAQINNHKWFPIRQDMKYVKQNSDLIDFVLLCEILPNGDINFKYKVRTDIFIDNIKKSNYDGYYFNHFCQCEKF